MIGKYAARMDDKSRLIVPAKLRGELGDSFFVTGRELRPSLSHSLHGG